MGQEIMSLNSKIILKSSNSKISAFDLATLDLKWDDDYLIFKDRFNRKWKLVPVSNENIKFPFIITPLSNDP